jgi:ketosteroid isomerase-like protein
MDWSAIHARVADGEAPLRELDAYRARSLLDASHGAWCNGDIDRLLSYYADDCLYWCNAGAIDGSPFTLVGKPAFRDFLRNVSSVAESRSVIDLFQFDGKIARAQIDTYVRHRRTGHVLAGSYRQVVTYRGNEIWRIEEYHDAARMAAFWRLVASEETAGDPQ